MSSTIHFQTLSPTVARVVAVLVFLLGLSGAIYSLLQISGDHYMGGIMGFMFALIFVAIGFRGPSSVTLYGDRLSIRRGAWKPALDFPLKEIKEINFTSDKKGKIFTVRTKTSEVIETFRFNQPPKITSLFAQELERLKLRVSGKR